MLHHLESFHVTSCLVATLVAVLLFTNLAQGKGSSDLMVPPRHRPYFEAQQPPPRHENSLYYGSQSISFVQRHLFYREHFVMRRDVEDDGLGDRCREFEVGSPELGEFYSPNYPSNYPNHTECIRLLEAAPGYLLKLDFRDKFDLESNYNCTYDYLEIRDGGHGFDRLISRFCGNTFPPMIISTTRYLWLRFVSDDTIEGAGFTAVYESIRSPNGPDPPDCTIMVTGYEGWVNSTDIDDAYINQTVYMNRPIDCMWVVNLTEGWKVQLQFKTFELNKPNDCDNNFVDIFSPSTEVKHRVKKFCSSMAEMVTSANNILYVRFYMDMKARNSSFASLFTAFREGKKEGGCLADEFDCQDERCIKKELECNGIENCRHRWDDDDHCVPKAGTIAETLKSEHIIIILVIFCLILSGMCFTFVFNCVRKLIHDHRIIQEHMRQSRQSRLDQVGKVIPHEPTKVASVGRSRSNSSSGGIVGGSVSPHHLVRAVADSEDGSTHRATPPDECYVPGADEFMPILLGANSTGCTATPANGDVVFPRNNHHQYHHHHHHHHRHHHENDEQGFEEEEEDDDMELSAFPLPEMRDNECQTRESLFMNTNSDHSFTPPPPPPPVIFQGNHRHVSKSTPQHSAPHQHSSSNTSAFSTFREHPQGRTCREESGGSSNVKDSTVSSRTGTHHPMSPESKHFRAEAVIEMDQASPKRDDQGIEVMQTVANRPFSVESTKSAPDVIVTH